MNRIKQNRYKLVWISPILLAVVLVASGCSLVEGVMDLIPKGEQQSAAPEIKASATTVPPEAATATDTQPPPTITIEPTATIKPTLRPTWTVLPATLVPTWTASPTLIPSATPNVAPIFFDDFSDLGSGWMVEKNERWSLGYSHNGYMIGIYVINAEVGASRPFLKFSETRIEVDVRRLTGQGYYGVSCRDTGSSYYSLVIGSNGKAGIFTTRATKVSHIVWEPFGAVKTAIKEVNHLRGECRGNTLTLWVNGEVAAFKTLKSPGLGWVGIVSGTDFDHDKLEVIFDNVRVWGPE